ncbi:hypothetical protein OAG1_30980 [Agarivorans sp. OAG1]|uniref:DUF465 domain-containing protein n=1 Tax=Agarivorans albus MKT 106 TaxID=1331007 RepID=R9PIM2_AGAAL|nr:MULTISPECIES: DUF465 domain-containing protein [Agarivorans]MPW27861.1 DUF465 domain-containing protein [Agarivorans sp. B2Z047]UQN44304.1 DUF465 domain-containing protein [Agarivorans sp. B2Z047]BEU04298.1 hypothetical protein OAG1_30980 [Agarivorans sp. OAG1]GAD01192.1 hypothetical protein AALB_1272 [Agarivorans albus MKT 106]
MLGENHALIFEFPEHRERIHQLKVADSDFNSLAKRYHQLDHKIRGLEATQVPAEDQYFMQMKLQRVQLKQQIFSILSQANTATAE